LDQNVLRDLRKHHFDLGNADEKCRWLSSSRSDFVAHMGSHRSQLSAATRADLRASHFSLESSNSSNWISCNHADFKDFSGHARAASFRGTTDQGIFPFEEETNYVSETRRACPGYYGVPRTQLADSVKTDLRRSHFTTSGDCAPEFESVFSSSYKNPGVQSGDSKAQSEMKLELSRSHFDLWRGSMRGYQSETKSAFLVPERS
jgi:hypothetical protein